MYAGDHDTNSKARAEVFDGIHYFIIPTLRTSRFFLKPNDPFTAVRRLINLPKKNYDVYHLFQPFLQALVPWNYLRHTKKKSIFIYDWDDLWTDGLFLKPKNIKESLAIKVTKQIEKKTPNIADGVTVCSDFLAKKVNPRVPVTIIGNGFWTREKQSKNTLRKKWKFADEHTYIGYIGKTAGELDWIVDGFHYLTSLGLDNIKLVIVGPDKSQFDKFAKIHYSKLLYFGQVSPTEAVEIATAIDLGLIPLENSLFNQSRFPIKFFDFLNAGTSVYMSGVGDIAVLASKVKKAIVGPATKKAWIEGLGIAISSLKTRTFTDDDASQELSLYEWPSLGIRQLAFYLEVMEHKFEVANEIK